MVLDQKPASDEYPEMFGENERCPECGHAAVRDEPVHYADCRYFILEEVWEDDNSEVMS